MKGLGSGLVKKLKAQLGQEVSLPDPERPEPAQMAGQLHLGHFDDD